MADKTESPATQHAPEITGNARAPVVYFDFVPTFAIVAGAVAIEMAAKTILPADNGQTRTELVMTAHLRCSPAAAEDLRQAIEKVLLMLQRPEGPAN